MLAAVETFLDGVGVDPAASVLFLALRSDSTADGLRSGRPVSRWHPGSKHRRALPASDVVVACPRIIHSMAADFLPMCRSLLDRSPSARWFFFPTAGATPAIDLRRPPFSLRLGQVLTNVPPEAAESTLAMSRADLAENLERAPFLRSIVGGGRAVSYDRRSIVTEPRWRDRPVPARIPRLVHLVWVGPRPVPSYVHDQVARWRAALADVPAWSVRLWTNADLVEDDFDAKVLRAVQAAPGGAQKADIVRYWIVRRRGGFVFDVDIEPLHSLEPLLQELRWAPALGCHYERFDPAKRRLSNGMFAAEPRHPWIERAAELSLRPCTAPKDVDACTGPGCLGAALRPLDDDMVLLPTAYFFPTHWSKPRQPYDRHEHYGVHHWSSETEYWQRHGGRWTPWWQDAGTEKEGAQKGDDERRGENGE